MKSRPTITPDDHDASFLAAEPTLTAKQIEQLNEFDRQIGRNEDRALLGELSVHQPQTSYSARSSSVKFRGQGELKGRKFAIELFGVVAKDGTAVLLPTQPEEHGMKIRGRATCLEVVAQTYSCRSMFVDVYVRFEGNTYTDQFAPETMFENETPEKSKSASGTPNGHNHQHVHKHDDHNEAGEVIEDGPHPEMPDRKGRFVGFPAQVDELFKMEPPANWSETASKMKKTETDASAKQALPSATASSSDQVKHSDQQTSGAQTSAQPQNEKQNEAESKPSWWSRLFGRNKTAEQKNPTADAGRVATNENVTTSENVGTPEENWANARPTRTQARPIPDQTGDQKRDQTRDQNQQTKDRESRPTLGESKVKRGNSTTPSKPSAGPSKKSDTGVSTSLAPTSPAPTSPAQASPPSTSSAPPSSSATSPAETSPTSSGTNITPGGTTPAPALPAADQLPEPVLGEAIGCHYKDVRLRCFGGSLMNAVPLDLENPFYRILYPHKQTHFGTSTLIDFVERIGRASQILVPGFQLAVGDLSAQTGGRLRGHVSHQNGLDADLGYLVTNPGATFTSVTTSQGLAPGFRIQEQWTLFKKVLKSNAVSQIFVNHTIKRGLCTHAKSLGEQVSQQETLSRLTPWSGHNKHWHLRLRCPTNNPRCKDEPPPEPTSGCF